MFKIKVGDIKSTPTIRIYKMQLFIACKDEISNPESNPIVIANIWLESTGFIPLRRLGYKNFFLRSTRIYLEEKKITRADGRLIEAQNTEEMIQKAQEALDNLRKTLT
jgi:hypothetical protein